MNLIDSIYEGSKDAFDVLRDHKGFTYLYQPYIHWQFKPSNSLTFNVGLNYEYLALNNKSSWEPRAGVKWSFNENKALSEAIFSKEISKNTILLFDRGINSRETLDAISDKNYFITRLNKSYKSKVISSKSLNIGTD